MRIRFASIDLPKHIAKRLKRVPPFWDVPLSAAQALTAYVLGYKDWHELEAVCKEGSADPCDEEVTPEELSARRSYQSQRLAEHCFLPFPGQANQVIDIWQPSAKSPFGESAPKWVPVSQVKLEFQRRLSEGYNRAFIHFFQDALDWHLMRINAAAEPLQPLAFVYSERMDLTLPILAPGDQDSSPLGVAEELLDSLVKQYPDGAIVLLGEPTSEVVEGHPLFSPGLLVLDGKSTSITLGASCQNFDSLFEFGENCYRVKTIVDVGNWASRAFAKARMPSWQADAFDE